MDEAEEGYGESNNECLLGEEEDHDYNDLYNDVNFNEGFIQLLRKNDNSGFRNGDVKENKPLLLSSGFRLLFMLQLFGSRFLNFKILGVAFIEEAFVYSQDKIYDFEMKLMDIDSEHLGIPEAYHAISLLRCHPLSLLGSARISVVFVTLVIGFASLF
ncbi:hypothetical protein JHK82_049320 [Glycine max]|nr:hypothetical protein JHK85_049936 [Glycine max]KAG5090542.1 hypothetical protein JHK82_049320 [Glycine max]KAG5093627.1 hypothetical protein JHK84_049215 [Glycine max]